MKAYVTHAHLVAPLRALGVDVVNAPTTSTMPLAQAERQAFAREVDLMLSSDVLVADATRADLAVGWAISWFLAKGRLAVVLVAREARGELPALVAGNPSPWCRLLVFDSDPASALAGVFSSG